MLALALGGRSIKEWQDAIDAPELADWIEFYRLFPFDDMHRFYRPAALLTKAQGVKASMSEIMRILQPDPLPLGDGYDDDAQDRARSLMNMGFKMAKQAKAKG